MSDLENDVRILRRQIAKGFVSNSSAAGMREKLPDISDQADYFDPTAEDPETLEEEGDGAEEGDTAETETDASDA